MHLEFTETQSLIQQTARDYAQRRIVPVAAQIDRESRFPKDILKELAELGLMGVNIPASLGGAEAGAVAYVLAMIEISRACASTAVAMSVTNMVGEVITNFGTEEQRNRYVPMLTSGSVVAVPSPFPKAAGKVTRCQCAPRSTRWQPLGPQR